MASEKEKMMAGELYRAFDAELEAEREAAHGLVTRFNDAREAQERAALLKELLGSFPCDAPPLIEPKFRCDYGSNIRLGRHFYANFDCCILDCNYVTIGDDVFFAPGVQIYTAGHPTDPTLRGNYLKGFEFAKPVRIGDRCWLGGCAIVLPGVTIGNDVTVGAGSVVTKDVPDGVVVAGNPARIIRKVEGYQ
jgi:maltose O-acetyltransferase|uniref:Maltose/galactoside acetyltransferase domain-containing protein n=1 Tax=Tetraselmis chuii TaxID=63592 RepID=A0A7S1SXP4_9CHLO|mmetsp:Transcript_34702/g.61880  ORF Transcript_34702/g.61880 Transcript_34702/m.61880 type:complete len:192 (+) Transcript_34702:106-681(+)